MNKAVEKAKAEEGLKVPDGSGDATARAQSINENYEVEGIEMTEEEIEEVVCEVKLELATRYVGEIMAEKAVIVLAPFARYLFFTSVLSPFENAHIALIFYGVEVIVDLSLIAMLALKFGVPIHNVKIGSMLTRDGLMDMIVQAATISGVCMLTMAVVSSL